MPVISRYFTSVTRGGRKKVLMFILMLDGNSLEIGCKMRIGFLGGEFGNLRKKVTCYFWGKSMFPGYIWDVFGNYRAKVEPICHLFPFGPYLRLTYGVFTGNMH